MSSSLRLGASLRIASGNCGCEVEGLAWATATPIAARLIATSRVTWQRISDFSRLATLIDIRRRRRSHFPQGDEFSAGFDGLLAVGTNDLGISDFASDRKEVGLDDGDCDGMKRGGTPRALPRLAL